MGILTGILMFIFFSIVAACDGIGLESKLSLNS